MDFPVWWDSRRFLAKYKDRGIDTNDPAYVDYGILLTFGEAMVWDRECRERFTTGNGGRAVRFPRAMDELTEKLRSSKWIIVESYEWESGLD
jgi:hypothetical protein